MPTIAVSACQKSNLVWSSVIKGNMFWDAFLLILAVKA